MSTSNTLKLQVPTGENELQLKNNHTPKATPTSQDSMYCRSPAPSPAPLDLLLFVQRFSNTTKMNNLDLNSPSNPDKCSTNLNTISISTTKANPHLNYNTNTNNNKNSNNDPTNKLRGEHSTNDSTDNNSNIDNSDNNNNNINSNDNEENSSNNELKTVSFLPRESDKQQTS